MTVCPECLEPIVNVPPVWRMPAAFGDVPEWSHRDGEPLCPVMGDSGYQPAPSQS